MIRPGPDRIDPGCAPGGLVICTYDLNGECLTENVLMPGASHDAAAAESAAFLSARLQEGEPYVVVVYDGDTGARWGDAEWAVEGLKPGDTL